MVVQAVQAAMHHAAVHGLPELRRTGGIGQIPILTFFKRGDKKMAIMEISVVPIGTETPSVSKYIASALSELEKEEGVAYRLTPMATIVEAKNIKKLFSIAEKMHACVVDKGAKRVFMVLKIDDRHDKKLTMEGKIESVKKK